MHLQCQDSGVAVVFPLEYIFGMYLGCTSSPASTIRTEMQAQDWGVHNAATFYKWIESGQNITQGGKARGRVSPRTT
jgi:hypothetical protein